MIKNQFSSLLLSVLLTICTTVYSQINPKEIDIIRDEYGVPHIFAKTDAEVAYGLAWAHAEDDFKTIQQSYLAGNNMLSAYLGKKGIPADFLAQFIRSEELVERDYETKTSPEYKKILEGYAAGMNQYAATHPEEVLSDELFPVTPKRMMRYAQLQLFISSKGDYWVSKIISNDLKYVPSKEETKGSNTFAFNSSKTTDGNTYLAINTHQPLDGPVSWYEAHLCSEEGTNIIGALFAGSPSVLIGANEYLGWAHTVNQPDKTDVFELEMHPSKKNVYLVDGKEHLLESFKAKLSMKILGIPFKVFKKYYRSIYGPTLKNKTGYFSIRTPALEEVRGLEQWWRMNKTKSFKEFYDVLKMEALPGYNIGYADKNDTIFYISNGLIPKRAPGYNWKEVVPGNTMKTLWTSTYSLEELPQVIQPKSGYFYNTNHSPFKSTDEANNPKGDDFSLDMGFERYDNNRSIRLKELIDAEDKVSYEDFKRIKYDRKYPEIMNFSWMNINALFDIEADQYPDIKSLIKKIQDWDRKTDASSEGAGVFAVLYYRLYKYYYKLPAPKIFPRTFLIQALRDSKDYMLKHFNTTDITLGDYQKLVRGDKEIPIFGLPDVLTSMNSVPHKDGKIKVESGESYIELVRFTPEGTQIESSISYGSSDHPDSPHYGDQMEMYSKFETKKMSLNKEDAYKNAKRIYNPK